MVVGVLSLFQFGGTLAEGASVATFAMAPKFSLAPSFFISGLGRHIDQESFLCPKSSDSQDASESGFKFSVERFKVLNHRCSICQSQLNPPREESWKMRRKPACSSFGSIKVGRDNHAPEFLRLLSSFSGSSEESEAVMWAVDSIFKRGVP